MNDGPVSFVPCSRKHGKFCSPAHAQLVAGYRDERTRQELLFENETGHHKGDMKIWRENNTMITFKTWLISNKTTTNRSQKNEKICIVKQTNPISPATIPRSNLTIGEIRNEKVIWCDICTSYELCYVSQYPRCPRRSEHVLNQSRNADVG